MDKIFDEAEPMPPWRGHSMTGPITPLALSRIGQVNCKKIDCTKSKPIFNFLKKENFVRGIDLKIDDIWGLDLFMTGRACCLCPTFLMSNIGGLSVYHHRSLI